MFQNIAKNILFKFTGNISKRRTKHEEFTKSKNEIQFKGELGKVLGVAITSPSYLFSRASIMPEKSLQKEMIL